MSHYHCPHDCEHPQPFIASDGKRYCGRCWFRERELIEVFLCTPETCREEPRS